MSIRGFFELDYDGDILSLVSHLRLHGFPYAEAEEAEWSPKRYLIDLQVFNREDGGGTTATCEDIVAAARFLLRETNAGEILYSQSLDLRDVENAIEIQPDDLRLLPPSLSGVEGIYVVKENGTFGKDAV